MIHRNIYWAWQVLRARAYLIATDKTAVCNIPAIDPFNFDDITMLSSQQSALVLFRDKLDELLDEHKKAIDLLARREAKNSKKKTTKAKER